MSLRRSKATAAIYWVQAQPAARIYAFLLRAVLLNCHCEGAKRLRQSKIKNGKKEKRLPRYARNDSFVLSFWSKVVLRFYFSAYAPCQNDKDDEAIESQQYDIKKACKMQAFFTLKTEK